MRTVDSGLRFGAGVALALCMVGCRSSVRLDKAVFLDKCKGAWAGQMIGVCYGGPYEFVSNGQILDGPLKPWSPERIRGAIGQDDCYVEMTWLAALEQYGLDVTYAEAGQAFAEGKYGLAHANRYGRDNVRRGIMPPLSGHPDYNKHADDIDFQIEADLFGILCPGMPRESNRLCDVFGHIMNYGDGVYGGMFVAGMYCAAYFESEDVLAVVRAGLGCIPEESRYHKCITDVIQWHKENPGDWRTTWRKIEEKWQDDEDCVPGDAFNIDASLNGAYIVVGLLYGEGDMARTIEIATRCGQDADCNPSSAAGVLGCMKGYDALGQAWTGGVPAIADIPFAHTDYAFQSLIPACQRMTERIIRRAGGSITGESYQIAVQRPTPPARLEQWTDQMEILSVAIPPAEMKSWDPTWQVVACGFREDPGFKIIFAGKENVLQLTPVSEEEPAVMTAALTLPAGEPRIGMDVASFADGDWLLKVYLGEELTHERRIKTDGKWATETIDVRGQAGESVTIRVEAHTNGKWHWERAYFGRIRIES